MASQPAAGASGGQSGLTPHDIYQRDAPGVVYVRAKLVAPTESPFQPVPARRSDTSTFFFFFFPSTCGGCRPSSH